MLADIRYAWRSLFKSSSGTLVAILSIGFGVGVSTAIFGAVDQVLLASLPYPDAERIVVMSDRDEQGAPLAVAYGSFVEVQQRNRSFEALAVADRWQPTLAAGGEPTRLAGDRVSADYFRVLGVRPAVGRDFELADDAGGAQPVAIVSASLAQRRFGGSASVLGRPLSLDGQSYIVIGVMPDGFENALSPSVEVWAPLQMRAQAPFESGEWGHRLRMVGRLRAGVTLEQARRDAAAIGADPIGEFARPAWATMAQGLSVESLQASVTSEVRPALLAIFGAVLLLLAMACANVTNILLARALARRGELAMRAALGAARGRLVRQLFTESALLALVGGALGVAIAALAGPALLALAPDALPRVAAIRLDARVLAFAFATTAVVATVVGLVPALRAGAGAGGARISLDAGMRATPAGLQVLRRALVVAQVALARVLLASAGLLLRSVDRLLDVPLGFDASRVAALQVVATGAGLRSNEEAQALFERVLDAVRSVPGVTGAALTSQLPLSGDRDAYGVAFASVATADPQGGGGAYRYVVTPSWFTAMNIPLKRGRLLGAENRRGAPQAVLISESFAARRFAGRDPIGERVRIGPYISRPEWATVVGVVGDVKQASLAAAAPDAFYVALGQWLWVDNVQSLVVRTAGEPGPTVQAVKEAVWSVNSSLPIERVTTMKELVAGSEVQRTFAMTLFAAFGLAALLLAGVGVYGVIEGRVVERTREIGVRSALGASPTELKALVLRQGMRMTAAGIGVGAVLAVGATQGIASLLFGVAPFDPATYVAVAALLAAVAFVASYAPAHRAARIDPAVTLKAE